MTKTQITRHLYTASQGCTEVVAAWTNHALFIIHLCPSTVLPGDSLDISMILACARRAITLLRAGLCANVH
ncbi:hypothetical protein HBH56_140620 [Parastagonospora nodorum]|uniref:Uncharacterized protein n=1 Tax=Phaeosphaeria nodorum (strain SN15 / ATCC MYA-4574 / FGSC 10173) TaxID=321614 RepID=A0A7U2EV13_PHANO|nr:hypothetical protein HBH56_140620 [Parastagonospora nodorum]QRC91565.1 hypothetical protein JI435_300640 [Parastagonospora nodorum SN15]KAH3928047.1 hypothetical protein HBH54_145760 [Parastagonospora nodorum]KAH3949133.1 hypothetical protein HBH53_095760 [Parastagonospora nodorum]KAH4061320.1 hypothetical protein HBH49_013730 [Parastagonospora nodorum]